MFIESQMPISGCWIRALLLHHNEKFWIKFNQVPPHADVAVVPATTTAIDAKSSFVEETHIRITKRAQPTQAAKNEKLVKIKSRDAWIGKCCCPIKCDSRSNSKIVIKLDRTTWSNWFELLPFHTMLIHIQQQELWSLALRNIATKQRYTATNHSWVHTVCFCHGIETNKTHYYCQICGPRLQFFAFIYSCNQCRKNWKCFRRFTMLFYAALRLCAALRLLPLQVDAELATLPLRL